MTQREAELLTVSDIAKMAGTARSTVSNWKRRHADFPGAKGQNARGPLYDRQEIATWLAGREGLPGAASSVSGSNTGATLFRLADLFRDVWSIEEFAIATAGLAVGIDVPSHLRAAATAERIERLEREVASLFSESGPPPEAVVDLVLQQASRTSGRLANVTPTHMVRLMAAVLGPRTSVLDPACGVGGTLAACAPTSLVLCGQELNIELADFARARLASLTSGSEGSSEVQNGNSLLEDRFPTLFDGVVCLPPWRVRLEPGLLPEADSRWAFEYPRTSGDAAWIQHVLAHVAPGGRAVVALPPGALFETGVLAKLRASLVRLGLVRAVLQLPPRTLKSTNIAPVLVVLERSLEPAGNPAVLMGEPIEPDDPRHGVWSNQTGDTAARAITAWLDSGRVPDSDLYSVVGLDVLAAQSFDLTPRRYLAAEHAISRSLSAIRGDADALAQRAQPLATRLAESADVAGALFPSLRVDVPRVLLRDLVRIRRGIPLHQLATHGQFPVHTPASLMDGSDPARFLADEAPELQTAAPLWNAMPGDVLISLDGHVGRIHHVTDPMFVAASFAILRPEEPKDTNAGRVSITTEYLAAWLRSDEAQALLHHLAGGTAIRRISKKDLDSVAVPVPDGPTQKSLSDLDEKLEAAVKAAQELSTLIEQLRTLGNEATAATFTEDGK